jgi:hypothetical protein
MDVQNDHPKKNIDFHPFWSKQNPSTLWDGDQNNTP